MLPRFVQSDSLLKADSSGLALSSCSSSPKSEKQNARHGPVHILHRDSTGLACHAIALICILVRGGQGEGSVARDIVIREHGPFQLRNRMKNAIDSEKIGYEAMMLVAVARTYTSMLYKKTAYESARVIAANMLQIRLKADMLTCRISGRNKIDLSYVSVSVRAIAR